MIVSGRDFSNVWLVEMLCARRDGESPTPICVAAKELVSGRSAHVWLSDGGPLGPPFFFGSDDLLVCLPSIPLVSSFLALGWLLPSFMIDLHAEFRCQTNGGVGVDDSRAGLLRYFGESFGSGVARPTMDMLVLRGHFDNSDESDLQAYCDQRLAVLERLFWHICTRLDGPRSLFRGDFLIAAAQIEMAGVPVDSDGLEKLYSRQSLVCGRLVADSDVAYPGVFRHGRFSGEGFALWLGDRVIDWPRTRTGLLKTDDDTLKDMAARHHDIEPLRQLRKLLIHLSTGHIPVGGDGRTRCPTRPFASITGRSQPPGSQSIFGAPGWMRGFIRPPPGRALAMIDYASQEFAIGAALSGDPEMIKAYESSDPYLAFALDTGAIPTGASLEVIAAVRKLHKLAVLGILYGMGDESLAIRLGVSQGEAVRLSRGFRDRYHVFCDWQNAIIDGAYEDGWIGTSLGWRMVVTRHTGRRTLGNYLLQATAADILRIAVCLAVERGVKVCATIHDCLLIECGVDEIDDAIACASGAMREAGEMLLGGLRLRTDVFSVTYPERLLTPKQRPMWGRVMDVVDGVVL